MQRPCKIAAKPLPPPAPRAHASYTERLQAEHAFVREGESLADIAKAFARPYCTIKKWHDEAKWDEARKAFLLSVDGAADILEKKLQAFLLQVAGSEAMISGAQADVVLKVSRAVKELRGDRYSVLQAFQIFKDFAAFARAAQPDVLPLIEPLVERFLQDRRKVLLAREQ